MPLSRRMPGPEGEISRVILPGRREEVVVGIFGVDAALDRMAAQLDVFLRERQLLAGGDVHLQVHEIEAGDEFRDRMLHLQARVHLEEVEVAILVDQELDGAGVVVTGGFGDAHGDFAHAAAHLFVDERRGRLFEHLLMAALHGALALAEIDDVAVLVAEDLHLDVARILDELLDVDFAVAEGALRFAARVLEGGLQILAASDTMRMPLPPPPAAAFSMTG